MRDLSTIPPDSTSLKSECGWKEMVIIPTRIIDRKECSKPHLDDSNDRDLDRLHCRSNSKTTFPTELAAEKVFILYGSSGTALTEIRNRIGETWVLAERRIEKDICQHHGKY